MKVKRAVSGGGHASLAHELLPPDPAALFSEGAEVIKGAEVVQIHAIGSLMIPKTWTERV